MNSAAGYVNLFPEEREVFLREYASGLYGVPAYFCAKVVSELPNAILSPTILSLITYFALNLNYLTAGTYFVFLLVIVTLYICAGGFGMFLGAVVPDKNIGSALIPITIIP